MVSYGRCNYDTKTAGIVNDKKERGTSLSFISVPQAHLNSAF